MPITFLVTMLLAYLFFTVVPSGHAIAVSFTLYLHRQQTHGSVIFRRWLANAMRLCIWLHSGVNRRQWVAVHRKHHSKSDKPGDIHSPQDHGVFCAPPTGTRRKPLWPLSIICPDGLGLFWTNLREYNKEAKNPETVQKYGNIPPDALERYVTGRLFWLGPFVLLPLLHAALSGYVFYLVDLSPWWGLLAGPLAMALLLVWTIYGQAFVNSYGHAGTERDERTDDFSVDIRGSWLTNIILNLLFAGEQIHHGHHENQRKWNFGPNDLGGTYIKLLRFFRLATVQK